MPVRHLGSLQQSSSEPPPSQAAANMTMHASSNPAAVRYSSASRGARALPLALALAGLLAQLRLDLLVSS